MVVTSVKAWSRWSKPLWTKGLWGRCRRVGVGGWCLTFLMDLGDLSGGELLDHVDGLARVQRETEVKILLAARQHAVLNDAESIDPWQLKVPGGERARRFG